MTTHFGSAWDLPLGTVITVDGEEFMKAGSVHNPYPWIGDDSGERDNDWAHRAIADGADVRLPEEAA